jgi:predicted RNA binding protein YcfA (HicA-like mRNA interferase family)
MKTYKGRELIRLLERHGWEVVRVEGSHHILVKPGREEVISVPVHGSKDIKAGMAHHILRLADIDGSE